MRNTRILTQNNLRLNARFRYRFVVMAGLVPAIHVFAAKTSMPGTRPGMTGWVK
ncbi:hypothetical protein [Bradyrhizobium genosp. P]|uniref:hypothetical protein n=1 Tax=Bradyrhizobium genosp. P TaxID=83641 RepID=UPI003CEABB44